MILVIAEKTSVAQSIAKVLCAASRKDGYGLRRSEAIGLKWDAIDLDRNTIAIRHTVTSCDLDGKRVLAAADTTKTNRV